MKTLIANEGTGKQSEFKEVIQGARGQCLEAHIF
jgi:hypothetical protein